MKVCGLYKGRMKIGPTAFSVQEGFGGLQAWAHRLNAELFECLILRRSVPPVGSGGFGEPAPAGFGNAVRRDLAAVTAVQRMGRFLVSPETRALSRAEGGVRTRNRPPPR